MVLIDNAPLTYIGNSPIAGSGVFAEIPFLTNEIILDYRPYMDTFYKIRWNDLTEEQISHNWLIPIDEEHCLTSDTLSKFQYLNHNKNPNCIWDIKEGIIRARYYIPCNQELTIDYREEYRPNRKAWPEWI